MDKYVCFKRPTHISEVSVGDLFSFKGALVGQEVTIEDLDHGRLWKVWRTGSQIGLVYKVDREWDTGCTATLTLDDYPRNLFFYKKITKVTNWKKELLV